MKDIKIWEWGVTVKPASRRRRSIILQLSIDKAIDFFVKEVAEGKEEEAQDVLNILTRGKSFGADLEHVKLLCVAEEVSCIKLFFYEHNNFAEFCATEEEGEILNYHLKVGIPWNGRGFHWVYKIQDALHYLERGIGDYRQQEWKIRQVLRKAELHHAELEKIKMERPGEITVILTFKRERDAELFLQA